MVLPPGLSDAEFESAITEFRSAVGAEWVFTEEADVDLYRDAYSPFWGQPEERLASAAVAPQSVEEVQAVMRIANVHRVPIYPISTGKNLGYGGSAPNYSGSVVLDLKRMNRILDVDEHNASCLVEPGVSYFDMYRHLRDSGSKLWLDVPDPGWGSLMGNALDRGGGYTSYFYRNHFDAHCGMEVVLPDGDLLRTGMGALPGAETWQQYKSGFGPWIDGIFSQSNFGVVTKMGFWLMPQPEAYLNGTVFVPRYNDLAPLIDIMNYLENTNAIHGMPVLGTPIMQGALEGGNAENPEVGEMMARGASTAELEAYGLEKGIPYWSVTLKYYGAEKVIRAQWEHAKELYAGIPGVTFEEGEFYELPLSDAEMEKVHQVEFGIPNLSIFSIGARSPTNPTPTNGHIWFSPIIPRTSEAVLEANRVFEDVAQELDVPFLGVALPTTYWNRAFIYLFGFPISRDPVQDGKMREAFRHIVKVAAAHGWGEYRTAPAFQDDVMATYSFNDHALLRFHERLKDAIDPNGILAAGRYGIWPRHLRKDRI